MISNPLYQFYAYPNTYSIGVHLLLEETAVAYEIINPKLAPSVTDTAFLQASPHGRVPALILPNGSTMCESGAIALYLADTLNRQRFTVSAESPERSAYLQWLFYLSSTLQPEVMMVFHPEYYFSDQKQQLALAEAAERRLKEVWRVLELQYVDGPWMFEQGPTAVDFALATVLLWPECFPAPLQSNAQSNTQPTAHPYPSLSRMLEALSLRESFKKIMPWHLGATDCPPNNLREQG